MNNSVVGNNMNTSLLTTTIDEEEEDEGGDEQQPQKTESMLRVPLLYDSKIRRGRQRQHDLTTTGEEEEGKTDDDYFEDEPTITPDTNDDIENQQQQFGGEASSLSLSSIHRRRHRRQQPNHNSEVTSSTSDDTTTTSTPTRQPNNPNSRNESRILDRSGMWHQSRGRWGVERQMDLQERYCCCCVGRFWNEYIQGDWFHRLAYTKTCDLMLILLVVYCIIVVFFAFVYYGVSMLGQETQTNPDGTKKIIAFCDMEINDHMEALYFSLSTMTTIGYGVSDYYFGGCWTPLLLVLWQVVSSICFTAVATGILFQRIARGRKRGKTIAFSNKALVQRVNGIPFLMFRIGEMRSYHLMEATVRCYCIRHERLPVGGVGRGIGGRRSIRGRAGTSSSTTTPRSDNTSDTCNESSSSTTETQPQQQQQQQQSQRARRIQTTYFLSRQVKLVHPDEAYGSKIWMGLPQVVVHRLDSSSPLIPSSPTWYDEAGIPHTYPKEEPQEQENINFNGNKNPLLAVNNNETKKTNSKKSSMGSPHHHDHQDKSDEYYIQDLIEIEKYFLDREAEIVVLVEGTDEGTGAPTQARHSYKASDLEWNHTFLPCVFPYERSSSGRRRRSRRRRNNNTTTDDDNDDVNDSHRRGRGEQPICSIDFMRFHDSVEVPANSDSCAYIPHECYS